MLIQTKGKGIELLNKSLPYAEQMSDINLDKDDAICFTWRGLKCKLDLRYCRIEEVDGNLLIGSNAAILMTQCLKAQL